MTGLDNSFLQDDHFPYVIPLTKAMQRTLQEMENRGSKAKIVRYMDGLPVLRYPSGLMVLLMTTGRIERIRPGDLR
jgi:hypothetical protein